MRRTSAEGTEFDKNSANKKLQGLSLKRQTSDYPFGCLEITSRFIEDDGGSKPQAQTLQAAREKKPGARACTRQVLHVLRHLFECLHDPWGDKGGQTTGAAQPKAHICALINSWTAGHIPSTRLCSCDCTNHAVNTDCFLRVPLKCFQRKQAKRLASQEMLFQICPQQQAA